MSENVTPPGLVSIELPRVKPIRLGEYGKALDQIWTIFAEARKDGFYAADENQAIPRFNKTFALHGVKGKYWRKRNEISFTPSNIPLIKDISNIGVISSNIEFEDKDRELAFEEETFGTADFWIPSKPFTTAQDFIKDLRERLGLRIGSEYVTAPDTNDHESATIMFTFDTLREGLRKLMQYSMRDTQPKEQQWASQFGDYYVNFPLKGSGLQLAVPIGLPANYIEYVVINEQSLYWQGKVNDLQQSLICDGHQIPLVSVNTNQVIK